MKQIAAVTLLMGLVAIASAQTPPTTPNPQAAQPSGPPASQAAAAKPPGAAESREVVYGSQLMTAAERAEYHAKMRSLKTQADRDAFRAEHHKAMQVRANERGVTLRDMPPGRGMGQGPGPGKGLGIGPRRAPADPGPPKSN